MGQDKILGDARRELLLKWLKESSEPITGSDLAKRTQVSRQVIVQDISLLKAKKEPILATAQGYVYMLQNPSPLVSRVIACKHTLEETEKELLLIVDQGVTVKDVIVEHPIYGELTASLRLSSRRDVQHFIQKLNQTNASLLSDLTDGTHLHTIEAASEKELDLVEHELEKAGLLLS